MTIGSTAYITKAQAEKYALESDRIWNGSRFGFLNSHNGLRPGKLHTMMGVSGGGKSTMIRSMIRDFAFCKENTDKRMMVWLSEESVEDFRVEFSRSGLDHERLVSISIFSELDEQMTPTKFQEILVNQAPAVLLYDNITTSSFYADRTIRDQNRFCQWMKKLTKTENIATVMIAHTGANVNDSMNRLIEMNDIRGSKAIVNLSEFFYILQRFQLKESFFPTITISKSRGQDVVNRIYKLDYDKHFRSYTGDVAIDFEKFKKMFNERNRL